MDDNASANTPLCYRTLLGFWVHGPGCTANEHVEAHAEVAEVGSEGVDPS